MTERGFGLARRNSRGWSPFAYFLLNIIRLPACPSFVGYAQRAEAVRITGRRMTIAEHQATIRAARGRTERRGAAPRCDAQTVRSTSRQDLSNQRQLKNDVFSGRSTPQSMS